MKEPTEQTEKDRKKKGMWKEKVYSKQLVAYANQSLKDDEKGIYNSLFDAIREEHNIEKPEELMMLDILLYDFIRIKRIQNVIMKEGDLVKITLRGGKTITKANEASYLLNAVETQFRNNAKELMMTRKEITKKKIGLGEEDFASFLSKNTVDADFKVEDGKDSKTN